MKTIVTKLDIVENKVQIEVRVVNANIKDTTEFLDATWANVFVTINDPTLSIPEYTDIATRETYIFLRTALRDHENGCHQ